MSRLYEPGQYETICAWSQYRDICILRMEYPDASSEFCARYVAYCR